MSYPHDYIVRLWLAGTPIQYEKDGVWLTLPAPEVADKMPHFYPSTFYRVKPRSIRFRVADLGHGARPAVAFDEREAFTIENSPGFVRWLTDWQEIPA